MLIHLSINNLAIIDDLDLPFRQGLTIMSGETGAGKSIIINAVNLILGGRASSDLIRTGCTEGRVEALFNFPPDHAVGKILEEMGVPFEGELLIKRTISREGRNRVFMNGSMATLQMLSALGGWLISVSGQHEYQLLLKPENHLLLLDGFGGLTEIREHVAGLFRTYQKLCREAEDLEKEISRIKRDGDLALFQIEEIEKASPFAGEDHALSEEKRRLQHAEELKSIAEETFQILYESPDSVFSVLYQCVKKIEKGASIDPGFLPVSNVLTDALARLEDASCSIRDLKERLRHDPERMEVILERMELLGILKRKYGPSLEDVLAKKETLRALTMNCEAKESSLKDLFERRRDAEIKLLEAARLLSDERKRAALEMEKAVEKELDQLHLKGTRFKVIFTVQGSDTNAPIRLQDLRQDGMDRIEFLMAANVGEELRPLSKIASGGELSRIMLALKTILARAGEVETVIFDEVDSGVSGAAAEVVGEKLLALSTYHQVLCITHLPQIAGKGEFHYLVRKEVMDGRTRASVSLLEPEERVREIARLLGGREISQRALAHAADLLS
ncbi:MAG: DNA repair protein RecN [Desulfobacteraceae bacterium]|nr:MAG: DNA repair protein RecN [Desulfobacteraceae bacterium]